MNRHRQTTGFALALALALATAEVARAQEIGPRVDSIFARINRTDAPGCVVGVGQNGQMLYQKGYGLADVEHSVPLSAQTIVEIGSVSKQFTAAAILLLEQDGKLSLDDDVRKYVPELPDFGKTLTLRRLASHTSGLRDQWALLSILNRGPGTEVHTVDEIIDLLSRQKELNFAPGDDYLYSNAGYVVLGRVVQNVSGKSLADFTAERIFKPLGMNNTQWRDDFTRVVKGRAYAYSSGPNNTWSNDMPFTNVYGNGGLLTTVEDLAKWKFALFEDRVGKPGFTAELLQRTRLNTGRDIAYAQGISNDSYRGTQEISHGGSTAGYRAHLVGYPEKKLAIAVLCNASNAGPQNYAMSIANLFLPEPPRSVASTPRPAQMAPEKLAGLAGLYRDRRTEDVLTLEAKDGKLVAQGRRFELIPVADDRFVGLGGDEYRLDGKRFSGRSADGGTMILERVTPVQLDAQQLQPFAGRFRSAELEIDADIIVRDGKLVLQRRLAPDLVLQPTFTDAFRSPGGSVVFSRDASGRVDGFRITAGRVRYLRFDRR